MQQNNSITEFILLGLTQDPVKKKMVFVIFILYMGTMLGNLLIIVTIKFSRTFGSPMYFFLFYLSLADSCFSTSTAPRLTVDALSAKRIITYNECMTQVFALHFFGCMEVFVFILMAADHYVAICKSIRYPTIMRRQVCTILIVLAYCTILIVLAYCCDLQPLLKLACMDTYMINLEWVSNGGTICTSSFVFLMISHIVILLSLQNHSAEGRKKTLSTCTSHIIIVILFFCPCIFIYTHTPTSFPMDKMVSVFYTIGTPLLKPLIYTLRNAEVKNAMRKLWHIKITSESQR
ncbi:olfactory receptor 4C11-like [Callorhinus ursinus]|uniref:olfactory receptor 4C11-like n=1 Tax=Callorhinus ursinus TaxID=34884 RepID=UPI003CD03060